MFSQGAPTLSSATEEAIEEGGCFLGVGQASFVFFNKGTERTSNFICGRKFQDIEKGPASEGSKGFRGSSHVSPNRSGEWGWVPRVALASQSQDCRRSSSQNQSSNNCALYACHLALA